MMEIIEIKPQGFCGGVFQAMEKAKKAVSEDWPRPITILGSLVHNAYANQELEELGLRILEAKGKTRLELLDEIESGTVIFTAHGVSDAVRQKAAAKGLAALDASCPFVLATQKLIASKKEGAAIFYVGKAGHPESEGALEGCQRGYLIEKEADIPEGIEGPIFVTNQTTMSVHELQKVFDAIQARYPQAEVADEICSATRVRQQAVQKLEGQNVDVLVVVGDPASNNTRKLADTGKLAGIPCVVQIENVHSLDLGILEGCQKVAITSGASTPPYLKNEVIEMIRQFDQAYQ